MRLTPFWADQRSALFFFECLALWLILLSGCSSEYRLRQAQIDAKKSHFESQVFTTKSGRLIQGFVKKNPISPKNPLESKIARIYIEGDGWAWATHYRPSEDPTPSKPMGLKLALADQSKEDVIYWSRPCQYLKTPHCSPQEWTFGRFHGKIIQIYQEFLDKLKQEQGYVGFHLHGFSGGATVALLIATQRTDVLSITTFAGLLDTTTWTQTQHCTPLYDSLNPIDYAKALSKIPQVHYQGSRDKTIGPPVIEAYQRHFKTKDPIKIIFIPGYSHYSAWDIFWRKSQEHAKRETFSQ